ncbi:MAG: class I adenylate-forming enzyme family protein [Eubacteriales bacterium]|jgi:long-chain acyl-CoA synthetase
MSNVKTPWLSAYGDIPASIDYPPLTMYQMVKRVGQQHLRYTAYEFIGRKTSYAALLNKIDRAARALYAGGIRPGDRVTICMPNAPQAVDCFYALNKIGAVANMIHPLSAPGEIEFYLRDSDSRAVLTLDQFCTKVMEAAANVSRDITILVATIQEELSPIVRVGYELTQKKYPLPKEGFTLWKDFLKGAKYVTEDVEDHTKTDTDPGAILYSGGTTGTTKGIILSNRNFNALGLQTAAASGCMPAAGLKMLAIMPIFHGFGLGICIHTALITGMHCILVPKFSIDSYTDLLKKKKPNFIAGVPTLYEALLRNKNLDGVDLSYLRGVFSGGDTLSIELKKKVDAFLAAHNAPVQIREGYGTTECVTASCLTPPHTYKEGSIGVPFPDMLYRICKVGTDEEVPYGEEGEICIAGPTVMLGYNNNPAETAATLHTDEDGRVWLHTGDLGIMDEEGYVYFRQRIKRMIITSGYNVYPSQVENIIDAHPSVLISCVIGVRDTYKMEKVKAFVVLRPGVEATQEVKQEILDYCKKHIAKYAMPYAIEFRDELPKTLVGKVAYRKLEEEEALKYTAKTEKAE